MRSGYVTTYQQINHYALRGSALVGYNWSTGTVGKAAPETAYGLDISADDVIPSSGPFSRHNGFPLRCLSTTAMGVRSGGIDTKSDTDRQPLRGASILGYGWPASPSTASSTQAYRLGFNANVDYPSSGPDNRRYGFSLRCLSTTAVGMVRVA